MAKAILLPKRFSILLFFLGLSAALISAGYIADFVVLVLSGLGQAGGVDEAASLWAIIVAAAVVILMAKSQRAIIALLSGYIAGCLIRFLLMLPPGA